MSLRLYSNDQKVINNLFVVELFSYKNQSQTLYNKTISVKQRWIPETEGRNLLEGKCLGTGLMTNTLSIMLLFIHLFSRTLWWICLLLCFLYYSLQNKNPGCRHLGQFLWMWLTSLSFCKLYSISVLTITLPFFSPFLLYIFPGKFTSFLFNFLPYAFICHTRLHHPISPFTSRCHILSIFTSFIFLYCFCCSLRVLILKADALRPTGGGLWQRNMF